MSLPPAPLDTRRTGTFRTAAKPSLLGGWTEARAARAFFGARKRRMVPRLVPYGVPQLFTRCPEMDEQTMHQSKTRKRIRTMIKAQEHYGGVGIAAPQLGWMTRVFVMGTASERDARASDALRARAPSFAAA